MHAFASVFFPASDKNRSLWSSQLWLIVMFLLITLVCWSLYELCCLCVCVVDGDETRCLSRRDLSSLLLASCLFSDPSRHVTDCKPCTSWNVTWQLHWNWEPSSSDSLWDRCLLIAKFRSAFCSCYVAEAYDRRRWAADLSPPPDDSTVHTSLTQWYRLHIHNSVKYLAVRTKRWYWSERFACVLI